MKKILWMLVWSGWGLTVTLVQTTASTTAQTNAPAPPAPVVPRTVITLHAPTARKRPLLGTNVQAGGFLVKAAKVKPALQAINPFAPVPVSKKYLDLSLDPRPEERHGLALFWISF